MISHKILIRQDIGRTASYYKDSADDYYAKEGESSEWQGAGAEFLDLTGPVDAQRFRELLGGQVIPGQEAERKSTRDDSKARIGIDLTFSAPKSVSLQALVHGDVEIIKAHDRAVAAALEQAEKRAQAREKSKGVSRVEDTGNLVIAKFRHETSREKDPQLHTHAVVLNLTRRKDGKWRALTNDQIIKSSKYLGAVYRSELAHELSKLGYQLRHERDGFFELSHISREQLEGFSKRSAQIEERLAEKGLNRATATVAEKQQAALQTRARKGAEDREEIFNEWQSRAKELEINFGSRDWAGESPQTQEYVQEQMQSLPANLAAKKSVDYAIKHLTERSSLMKADKLFDIALKHSVGAARIQDIEKQISKLLVEGYLIQGETKYVRAQEYNGQPKSHAQLVAELVNDGYPPKEATKRVDEDIKKGRLVPGEHLYTIQTAIEREKRILQIEREGRGKVAAVMSPEIASERLNFAQLNDSQRGAAQVVLTSKNIVTGIQGLAGVGKSHMLDQTKTVLEEHGFRVRALAPYASQVKALRELGVESNTLASFLYAKDKKIDERTVIVLDEAGVIPTRQMEQVLKIAEKYHARIVLLGDTQQTKAIEAGRPFDQLQANGMKTATMDNILRQHNLELKKAVELAATGRSADSLQHVQSIVELNQPADRHKAIAVDYAAMMPLDRDKTIIVTGTNESRLEINELIREHLGLSGKGTVLGSLGRRDTTQAERRYARHYKIGDIIQPDKDYKTGLKKGGLYTVTATGPGNRLTVEDAEKKSLQFSPMTHTKLSVYALERKEFAPGDLVKITRNDAQLDLANGDRMRVVEVDKGNQVIRLSDGKRNVTLPTMAPLHVDHAYTSTVHGAQGLTQDRVLINVDTRSLTTAQDVHYVAISRARLEAKIYTDSITRLPAAVSRQSIKDAALDLIRMRRVKEQIEKIDRQGRAQRQKTPDENAREMAARERERQRTQSAEAVMSKQKGDSQSDREHERG